MIVHSEQALATQPALVLLYGTTGASNLRRVLDREAVILGRSRGCDLALEAPDVSSPHCIITRDSGGFAVRDLGSRAGTRVNGDPVQEAILHDGDLLQVGPFSFRVVLPPRRSLAPADARHLRLERQRRNLIRLALTQRQRLRERKPTGNGKPVEPALLSRVAALQERVRQYDQRLAQLAEAERGLSQDQELLRQEQAEFYAEVQAWEESAARRPPPEPEPAAPGNEGTEEARRLQIRGQELEFYAHYLKRRCASLHEQRQQLDRMHEHLTRGLQAMHVEKQESAASREEWLREQAEATAKLAQQRAAIVQAEKSLREQRAELLRMMADLKRMQEAVRQQQSGDVEALRQENIQLREALAQRQQQAAALEALEQENAQLQECIARYQKQAGAGDGLREENARLREALTQAQAQPAAARPDLEADLDKSRHENKLLRRLVQEKDALLEELRKHPQLAAAELADPESFEAELNEFRRQLERDRQRLNDEIEQLRVRNQELDEATREMEMELSRERADLARERTRLERLREEVKAELERFQRDAGMRDRLAPVQRLRGELLDR